MSDSIPSLQQLAASTIVSGNLQVGFSCSKAKGKITLSEETINVTIKGIWDRLKGDPRDDFGLAKTMQSVEGDLAKEIMVECAKEGICPGKIDDLLAQNVNLLFTKLAEKYDSKCLFNEVIPVDFSSYCLLHQALLNDGALLILWKGISTVLPNCPKLNTCREIRSWLSDPQNQPYLGTVKRLSFSNTGMKVIPPEIIYFTQLEELGFQNNEISENDKISVIPDCIGHLQQLRKLLISFNKISVIPDCVGNLQQLQILYIGHNEISVIPDCIGNLQQLEMIYIGYNQISEIPDWIGNLQHLQSLDLEYNPIPEIPDRIGALQQAEPGYFRRL
jgi:Leucine rich repeat